MTSIYESIAEGLSEAIALNADKIDKLQGLAIALLNAVTSTLSGSTNFEIGTSLYQEHVNNIDLEQIISMRICSSPNSLNRQNLKMTHIRHNPSIPTTIN